MKLVHELSEITAKANEEHLEAQKVIADQKKTALENLHGLDEKIHVQIWKMEIEMRNAAAARQRQAKYDMYKISNDIYHTLDDTHIPDILNKDEIVSFIEKEILAYFKDEGVPTIEQFEGPLRKTVHTFMWPEK